MTFLQSLGLSNKPRGDEEPMMSCVDSAVDHALQAHHEARVAIRNGNGRVINMLDDALKAEPAEQTRKQA